MRTTIRSGWDWLRRVLSGERREASTRVDEAMKLVVGLGNPGKKYQGTRHNVGFEVIAELAHRHGPVSFRNKFKGEIGDIRLGDVSVRLLMPHTYMNLSGQSVAALARFYKISPEQILIAHDELDIPAGSARFKKGGGHGGHNGLRDIVPALGNNSGFHRLRIGIGHPGHASRVSGYVLSAPSADDRQKIDASIDEALAALPLLLDGDDTKAMTRLHSFKA